MADDKARAEALLPDFKLERLLKQGVSILGPAEGFY